MPRVLSVTVYRHGICFFETKGTVDLLFNFLLKLLLHTAQLFQDVISRLTGHSLLSLLVGSRRLGKSFHVRLLTHLSKPHPPLGHASKQARVPLPNLVWLHLRAPLTSTRVNACDKANRPTHLDSSISHLVAFSANFC